ncbi:hypothetical protein F4556_006958 [Kitasatospora gansuensis]|uniref:Uncharacterized protein n=1 Tax=Kitasatospora gansuensis TaxID=258050 RepID=A0A7W7SJ49_9ACTN|nr:hypothetical protein [Kitasatospora gansuensis]
MSRGIKQRSTRARYDGRCNRHDRRADRGKWITTGGNLPRPARQRSGKTATMPAPPECTRPLLAQRLSDHARTA